MRHTLCEWTVRLFMTAMRPVFYLSVIAWIVAFLVGSLFPELVARCEEYLQVELHYGFEGDTGYFMNDPGNHLALIFLAGFCCGYSLYLNGYYWIKLHLKPTRNRLWSPFPITYRKRTSHLRTMISFPRIKCVSRFAFVSYAVCAALVVVASVASGRSWMHIAFCSWWVVMLVLFVSQVIRAKNNSPTSPRYLDCLSLLWAHICVSAAMLFVAGVPVVTFFHASGASIWAAGLWLLLATLCYVMAAGLFVTILVDLFFRFRRRDKVECRPLD